MTSVSDLSKFLLAQMPTFSAPDGVFTTSMLVDMHTPTKFNDGSDSDTALGWSLSDSRAIGRYLEKNGGRNNTSAWIGFSPGHGVGVAVMVKTSSKFSRWGGFLLIGQSHLK